MNPPALRWALLAACTALFPIGAAEEVFPTPDISTASDSVVSFNEVQYSPGGDGLNEWVELFNQMSVPIDLSGWSINGGIQFQFPRGTTLAGNSSIVVAADPSKLSIPASGPFEGRLSNGGERLRLYNNNGRLMDEMSYSDEPPWPVGPDGSGGTLAKTRPFAASSPAANWRVSTRIGGTPGKDNFAASHLPPIEQKLVERTTPSHFLVPAADINVDWTSPGFDANEWQTGAAAIGFTSSLTNTSTVPVDRAYLFEGNFDDSSGNDVHFDNYGASFTPDGLHGQAAAFSGSGAHLRGQDLVNPSGYTLSAWVRVRTVRPCSIIVRTSNNGPDTSWSHQLRINSEGRFEHYLFDGGQRKVTSTSSVQANTWYHIAATATNNGVMRLYVNGISTGGSVSIGNLWSGGNQWRFGTTSGHTPNYYDGILDSVGIWHTVLAHDQVSALASGTLPNALNGYAGLIETDLQAHMFERNPSVLVRVPFLVAEGSGYDRLTLRAYFDDGFVLFLNNQEVVRRGAPEPIEWNSSAVARRDASAVLQPEIIDLTAALPLLKPGVNLLAVQALNSASDDPDFLFHPELIAREAPLTAVADGLVFNEIPASADEAFFVELRNTAAAPIPIEGIRIVSSGGAQQSFTAEILQPGDYLAVNGNSLNVVDGNRLFLVSRDNAIIDAVRIGSRNQARDASGRWAFPSLLTPAAANEFAFRKEIVINEIMYHFPPSYPPGASSNPIPIDEQWVELYNRSEVSVDLSGWQLAGGISYSFPPGTTLAAGDYLVVARDSEALRAKYPGIPIVGNFSGRLSRRADQVILLDDNQNEADELTYYDGAPWPEYADGGGSSLKLRDPRSDNSVPESWAASDESGKAEWRRYTYRAKAVTPLYSPDTSYFREFRMGLLNEGEALVDNVTVVELATAGSPRNLLQNTNFSNGASTWRLLGNHSGSRVQEDPDDPSNNALRIVSRGSMSYLDNRLETTLKAGGAYVPVVAGREYEFSFDARWVAGSPQLHSELYYNKVTVTHILDIPEQLGTPGARNSTFVSNAGPAYSGVRHSPPVPAPGQPITVHATVSDPDGPGAVTLRYSVNGGSWAAVSMNYNGAGRYAGTIPAQSGEPVIQFYIDATDLLGARSFFPAAGPESRALIKVTNPLSRASLQSFRIVMKPADATLMHTFANLMSDDPLGCTIVHNEREVFYDARIRLHGSMFSRTSESSTGFTIKFPADHLFRGTRASVVVRRSGMVESFLKHLLNKAGGLPANYDDIVHLVSHHPANAGPARLNLALYDDTYVDSQFPADNDGTIFKLEGIRIYQATDNGTPEGRKLPQPVDFAWSYDLTNLGDDPEQYRWSIMIGNKRSRDDYSRIVNMAKAFSLTGPALQQAIATAIDVDEWARLFAIQNLFGIGDIYGVDNPHNVAFYVRPSDGRVLALQNDWGFAFRLSASASITGKNNIYKVLALPVYRRLYHGHLHHLSSAIGDQSYLSEWAQRWSVATGESYSSAPSYLLSRGNSIRSQLPPAIPFEITSNAGNPISTTKPSILLQGRAWINVREIRLPGSPNPLSIVWLDDKQWQTEIPLAQGENQLDLLAFDHDGLPAGEDTIVVGTTASGTRQAESLRISELMYHPPEPSSEEFAAGFTDKNSFEFVELMNIGSEEVPLAGVRFTFGISFDFSSSPITTLAPNQRVLIVKNRSAFHARYGSDLLVAGEYSGQLDNAGETIRLLDQFGTTIQELAYSDATPWPQAADGAGPSLEVIDVAGDHNDPANYRASANIGGSPGRAGLVEPRLVSIHASENQVQIGFTALSGQSYTVYYSDDLSLTEWPILRSLPSENLPRTEIVTDPLDAGSGARFYRISTP